MKNVSKIEGKSNYSRRLKQFNGCSDPHILRQITPLQSDLRVFQKNKWDVLLNALLMGTLQPAHSLIRAVYQQPAVRKTYAGIKCLYIRILITKLNDLSPFPVVSAVQSNSM